MAKNYRIFLFDNGIKTQARVIGYDTQYDGEDDVYYPIIEFKDEKGISITTKLERGATHKMYANYKEIAILYDPTDPQDLIVLETDNRTILNWVPFVLLLFYFFVCVWKK